MEPLKASMIPTTVNSSAPNGSGVIVTSDPSRRTSNSFTIRTIGTAASRGKHPCRSSKKMGSGQSSHLLGTNYPRSALKFRREPFPSFVSSAVTESWISLGSTFPFPRPLFILMSGLKSLRNRIRFSFTAGMNSSLLSPTNYRHGWSRPFRISCFCPKHVGLSPCSWFFPASQRKGTKGVLFIKGNSGHGSYPQPRRSPVVEGRRSGAMDNFQTSFG